MESGYSRFLKMVGFHKHSRKGLEADAMVLVDVPALDAGFRKEHLYVACSRARHLLTVIGR